MDRTAPKKGSFRSIFKWGAPNRFKHPNKRLYAMLKEVFQLTDDDFKEKRDEGHETVVCKHPVQLDQKHIDWFTDVVGQNNVDTDDYSRVKYCYGKTLEEALNLRQGIVSNVPDAVIHPTCKDDIAKIVAYCHTEKIPITVFGGGSSVTFGLQCPQGGISLVMQTHMNHVISFNEVNQTITVEAGMMGPEYERCLNNAPETLNATRKYTGGHFPQSFEYSSVGGWVVTLGSGQQSSYYGDACDLVVSQEYVTPSGEFTTLDYPATATGPKVNDIMKGNEGLFGVLVHVTMKVFRYMPQNIQPFAFIFPSWDDAVNATREISQAEFGMPSVFRISDPEETDVGLKLYGIEGTVFDSLMSLRGYKPGERCLLIGQADGERDFAINVKKKIKKVCADNNAMYLTGYPLTQWSHSRYLDPYMREDLNDYGILIDTLESGVTWDKLHALHQGVREYIKGFPQTVCMTHASHFYSQGTNLYFIFIIRCQDIQAFVKFHRGIIEKILEHGGSLSHHHGVGRLMGPMMEKHLGKNQMDILQALKNHFDPNNIMNPGGTMGLDDS
ncbi:MAG: alkyldihydroxyacetonephosphate synthase [Candidatus Magnetoglobus multicellularis str. Araruama]|uniref:Alkyldihydroxyacetonephosphate synthase n=1 Tax=Candidatus Magnetoglobus multicellularis str. Araruama TaxID=890399 RepID=A0A1V1PID3_9BACT|nr:MAG: alkyldihydroxyacetonephosphate synthase [Candidatus Magnetoglobus multicellularis str. Araruama]